MEELLDQKKAHETSLAQRGSLLSVLLHQTTTTAVNTSEPDSANANSNVMEVDVKNEPQLSAVS